MGLFIKKIEKRINSNPDLYKKIKGGKEEQSQLKKESDIGHEFSSDTSTSLANIFKSNSISYIKLTSMILFIFFPFNHGFRICFHFYECTNN